MSNTAVIVNKAPLAAHHALANIVAGKSVETDNATIDPEILALVPFDPALAPGFNDIRIRNGHSPWYLPVPMRAAVLRHGDAININTHSVFNIELFDSEVATEQACIIDAASWFFDAVYVVTFLPDTFGANLHHLTTLRRNPDTGEYSVDITYNLSADELDAQVPNDALLVNGLEAGLEKFYPNPVANTYATHPATAPYLHRESVEFYTWVIEDITDNYPATSEDEIDARNRALVERPIARGYDPETHSTREFTAREVLERLGFFSDTPPVKLFTKYVAAKGPNRIVDTAAVRDALDVYDPDIADIGYAIEALAEITHTGNIHQRKVCIQPVMSFHDEVRFFLAGETIAAAGGRVLRDTPDIVALESVEKMHTWCNTVTATQLHAGRVRTTEKISTGKLDETTHIDPRGAEKYALACDIARDIVAAHGPQFVSIDIGTMTDPATGETTASLVEINHGVNSGYYNTDPYCVVRSLSHIWATERNRCTGDGWITWANIAPTQKAADARLMKLIGADISTLTPVN